MKALILNLLIWIISPAFSQESAWEKTPLNIIRYSLFNRMTFRQPVVFTPIDVKVGYLYYGGKNYWSQLPYNSSGITVTDLPVLLDSTQYDFNAIEKTVNRRSFFIEADFLRTNFTHFIFHQNYVDLQMGLGIQITNYSPDQPLPSDKGKEWLRTSDSLKQRIFERGNFYYNPKTVGINLNTSLGWQFLRKHLTYIYHSLGVSLVSIYESEGGDHTLTGIGLSESFGLGTKYIFRQKRDDFNYTFGIELKWNRLYMTSAEAPDGLSPIDGLDIRASGIFLTSGIQFGGKHTDGDIAYSQMMHNDFISASASFQTFLDREDRHFKRKKAIAMLQYCQSQISSQKVKLGVSAYLQSDFDEAIEWFNSAELDADDSLKIEIQAIRQNIASVLLDSVENHKNEMTITNAEKLARIARELYPGSKRYSQVMAYLYMDKAKLNTKIGNYSSAVDNYKKALQLYPEIDYIITEKLHSIANLLMKDAYLAYKENEIYLVLQSMKAFTKLQPQMSWELDPYILTLESRLDDIHSETVNQDVQQYIIDKKHESLNLPELVLQLGMTYEEAKSIQGTPQFIDKHTEKDQLFEMWTYPEVRDITHLYFRNNMLIRIEK